MATNLSGQTVSSTFGQLLHVSDNVTGTLKTVYGGNGAATAVSISTGAFSIGNISFTGNTVASTNTNGNIVITPDGTGTVDISKANITGGAVAGVSFSGITSAAFTGNAQTTTSTIVSSAGAVTINCTSSNVFSLTLNENTTLTVINPQQGQTINLRIVQDGTGGRTLAWPAGFKWPGGTAPSISSGANEVDLFTATYIGSDWYATLIKDFS